MPVSVRTAFARHLRFDLRHRAGRQAQIGGQYRSAFLRTLGVVPGGAKVPAADPADGIQTA